MPVTIHRRGEFWHYRGTVAGRRLRGSTGTADKGIAQRVAAEAESRAWKRHLDGDGAHLTMAQAMTSYCDAGKPTRFLLPIADHWRDALVRDVTGKAIELSARKLYPNAKPATWNRQVIVPTQAVINHAAGLGWCAPIKVRRFKIDPKVKIPVTRDWVQRFAAHASPHLGALCLFMFGTGARKGEAVALTWADVDLSSSLATIRQSKVEDTRTAHLPGPVVAALANIPSNRNPEDRVFGYAGAGSVKVVWDRVAKRAGLARLTPHSCRHGFATELLRAGTDVKTVAVRGGWKDAALVLRTYAHALEDATVTDRLFDTPLTQGHAARSATIRNRERKSK